MSLNKAGRKILKRLCQRYAGKGSKIQANRYLFLRCPFHHEKTASWSIDIVRGRHYCFGCHSKGDIWQLGREKPELLGRPKTRKSDPVFPYPPKYDSSYPEDDEIPF